MPIRYSRELPLTEKEQTPNSCHYSKGKTTSFSFLLLPTPNGMGRRRIHAAFILYKTLGYPELVHPLAIEVDGTTIYGVSLYVQMTYKELKAMQDSAK